MNRQPAHPSITPEQVSDLVDRFYTRIQSDVRLGPIFDARMAGAWDVHLIKMKEFWRSVLLRSGEYKGQPVPKHTHLTEVVTEDFQNWLQLFQLTVDEIFDADARPVVVGAAKRIASSLWLAMDGNV
jgi:hemoglobin